MQCSWLIVLNSHRAVLRTAKRHFQGYGPEPLKELSAGAPRPQPQRRRVYERGEYHSFCLRRTQLASGHHTHSWNGTNNPLFLRHLSTRRTGRRTSGATTTTACKASSAPPIRRMCSGVTRAWATRGGTRLTISSAGC